KTCGAKLPAGSSCDVTVVFAPTGAGSLSASLAFTDSASGTAHRVSLAGVGVPSSSPGNLAVNPSTVAFGTLNVGVSASQIVALSGIATSPVIGATVAPSTLTFAATGVGSTSPTQTVTLTNGGSSGIGISSIALSGANSSDFAVKSNSCGTNLAASANCTVGV